MKLCSKHSWHSMAVRCSYCHYRWLRLSVIIWHSTELYLYIPLILKLNHNFIIASSVCAHAKHNGRHIGCIAQQSHNSTFVSFENCKTNESKMERNETKCLCWHPLPPTKTLETWANTTKIFNERFNKPFIKVGPFRFWERRSRAFHYLCVECSWKWWKSCWFMPNKKANNSQPNSASVESCHPYTETHTQMI